MVYVQNTLLQLFTNKHVFALVMLLLIFKKYCRFGLIKMYRMLADVITQRVCCQWTPDKPWDTLAKLNVDKVISTSTLISSILKCYNDLNIITVIINICGIWWCTVIYLYNNTKRVCFVTRFVSRKNTDTAIVGDRWTWVGEHVPD